MLNLDLAPTFTRTASFHIPSGSGFVEQDCTVTFSALTLEEFAGFDMSKPEDVKRFLVRVVQGMGELVNGQGEPVDYSTAVRDQLINQDWGRQGLVRAYVLGRQKAAVGN